MVVRTETGATVVRTLEYSLPIELKGHVDMVQPTTFFGLNMLRSTVSAPRPLSPVSESTESTLATAVTGCSGDIDPDCLKNLYSFTGTSAYTSGKFGIAGFLEQWPSKSDYADFLDEYETQGNSGKTYTCTTVNGGTCPSSGSGYPGIEANLDVQYGGSITAGIPNTYYSVGGSPPIVGSGTNDNEPYLEFLDYMLALTDANLPNTLSISYGDDEATVPLAYADETCNLFAQLGARGVSVLVAAGDSGVGTTCSIGGVKQFTTSYPASCPWVTVVGGTSGTSPEKAWTDGGGGFSSIFGQPSYQADAVSAWLATSPADSAYFNSSGRAYPDVAAQATDFIIYASGESELVDGTSCATPTFAGVIQLVNSDRIANGNAALGFLNPWLYGDASDALTDITSGKITGCSGVITSAGFSAVSGWDPATGLGTPIFSALLAVSSDT